MLSTIGAWVGIKSRARREREMESRRDIEEANAYIDQLHADPVYGPLSRLVADTIGPERSGWRRTHDQEEVAAARLYDVLSNNPDYEVIKWRMNADGALPVGRVRHRGTGRVFQIIVFLNLCFDLTEQSGG